MVEVLQRKAMEIREVAGDVQFGNLALAARKILRPRQPPVEQQRRLVKLFAVADKGSVLRDLDDLRDEAADRLLFLRADIVARPKLPQMNIDHGRKLRSFAANELVRRPQPHTDTG
jgi:hypothetical protein